MDADNTVISSAVCALRMLASLTAAARLAVTANAAGSGWLLGSVGTRMVMSCRLGGSCLPSTVSVVYDIPDRSPAVEAPPLAVRYVQRSLGLRITRAYPPMFCRTSASTVCGAVRNCCYGCPDFSRSAPKFGHPISSHGSSQGALLPWKVAVRGGTDVALTAQTAGIDVVSPIMTPEDIERA